MSEGFKIKAFGSGPELVLLHGWAIHSGIWGGVVDALATEYRVNLVDLPGHGFNRHVPLSRDLEAVADLILSELPPAAWMGWSLGGLIALAAAQRRADKVKKMVLVGATPSFSRQEDWDFGVDLVAQQAFANGLENHFETTLEQFWLQTFGVNHVDEALRRLGSRTLDEIVPNENDLNAGLHLLYSNNMLPGLNRCKMPALFLGGTRDRTVRPESFSQAARRMPHARVQLMPGAGHAPFISHEDKFLEIIRGFLA